MNGNDGRGVTLTRLGRVVRTAGGPARPAEPQHREEHRQANWLRDVILGGQDGLVNILGIILGVIAGGGSQAVLLAAGFAAAFTESISMGAVGWTSALSERDYYQAEQARESAEIDETPEAERQEIRDIYAAKGFAGDLLERVVDTITANREAWLATMMDEELHLQPVRDARHHAQRGRDHDRHPDRPPDPAAAVRLAVPDDGADHGHRAQRAGAVRRRHLPGGDPGRRLAEEGAARWC